MELNCLEKSAIGKLDHDYRPVGSDVPKRVALSIRDLDHKSIRVDPTDSTDPALIDPSCVTIQCLSDQSSERDVVDGRSGRFVAAEAQTSP